MRLLSDALILSPSDLMRFQGCQHASALDLRLLKGEPLQPAEDALEAQLLQVHGDRHEHNYLERLRAECRDVGVVEKDGASLDDAVALTDRLLKDGREIIFQAAFRQGRWAGYSDFLERVDRPSALGGYSYEVIDTKLKRRPDPKHVLQLMLYSDLLEAVQGLTPEHAHLVLGDGRRVSLRVRDFRSYSRRLKQRLEGFVSEPWPTRPEPVQACGLCRWREYCSRQWDDEDALCLVAGITKSQSQKLEAAGITTLTDLANREDRIPGLNPTTLERLRVQARLQRDRRAGSLPSFELRPVEEGRGLTRLPKPAADDLFFDIEGDPLYEGGLEYLFGLSTAQQEGAIVAA